MCEDFCDGMENPEMMTQREPFTVSGERCVVKYGGETFITIIVPVHKNDCDYVEFYLQKEGYGYTEFMLGLPLEDLNFQSRAEEDRFILAQLPGWIAGYNETLQKIQS